MLRSTVLENKTIKKKTLCKTTPNEHWHATDLNRCIDFLLPLNKKPYTLQVIFLFCFEK